ncbi:MAG: Transcriptional regulator, AcrR family, partial [uncultured Solirubrobacteraceae bacterium]
DAVRVLDHHPPQRRRAPRGHHRRGDPPLRAVGLHRGLDRRDRARRRDLPAVPLPPLRHEEGALPRLSPAGARAGERRLPARRGGAPAGRPPPRHGGRLQGAARRPRRAAVPDAELRRGRRPGDPRPGARPLRRPHPRRDGDLRGRAGRRLAVLLDRDAPQRHRVARARAGRGGGAVARRVARTGAAAGRAARRGLAPRRGDLL